jgi:hypothetical protein
MENARRALNGDDVFANSMESCAAEVAVLAIATPWEQFKALRPAHLRKTLPRPVILDWWGILKESDFEPVADYFACGKGPAEAGAERLMYTANGIVS